MRIRRCLAVFAAATIIATPSVWFLQVIPPLWRDSDGYKQVTLEFGPWTILHSAPLYCAIARLPLYAGYLLSPANTNRHLSFRAFFSHPVLTDSGVMTLLVCQHVFLCVAALILLVSATKTSAGRILLAGVWASNPLFYVFGHCVGSETLSLILTLMMLSVGIAIMRSKRTGCWKEWLLLFVLLWSLMLTRFGNVFLVALLPLAILLSLLLNSAFGARTRRDSQRLFHRLLKRQYFSKGALALLIAVIGIASASTSLQCLAHTVHTDYCSRLGFTFLWRLQFLEKLPVQERNELLSRVASKTHSDDVKVVIRLLRHDLAHARANESPWNIITFIHDLQVTLSSPSTESKRFNQALNATAGAFLIPPEKALLHAAWKDFELAGRQTIAGIVSFIFETTAFYFHGSNADELVGLAPLITYRGRNAADIYRIFDSHGYLRLGARVPYAFFLSFWFGVLVFFAFISRPHPGRRKSVVAYAAALTLIGLIMMVANCLLGGFLPRYTLPMWELTIASAFFLCGGIFDLTMRRSAAGSRTRRCSARGAGRKGPSCPRILHNLAEREPSMSVFTSIEGVLVWIEEKACPAMPVKYKRTGI